MIRQLIGRLIPGPRSGQTSRPIAAASATAIRTPLMMELESRLLFAVPSAPKSLAASVVSSNTQIQLKWSDKSSNESGFEIRRGTSKDNLSKVGTVGKNATSYKETPPSKGKTYYYAVRAYNSSGKSGFTSTVSAKISTTSTSTGSTGANVSGYKTINISSSNLNNADWASSGEKIRWVLDSNAGPYTVSQHFITGDMIIESSNPSDPAVIKLPDVWDNSGTADNPTISVKGSLVIKNIKTTGGTDTILLGSSPGADLQAENISMDGGALWRGNGANTAYFRNNKIYGRPRANVYSSYGGTVKTCVIDNSGIDVPVTQGGRMEGGNPIGEAAIRIMNVDNLTLKGIRTVPWFYASGKVWKQDVQLRPNSNIIKVIDCKFYQVDAGDMVWRKPALPIDRIEFTNCTFNKGVNVTSGVGTIVYSNCKINGNTVNRTDTF